jgi:hypothetical protein
MDLTQVTPLEAMPAVNDKALETELALQFRFARENPRDIKRAMAVIAELATLDPDTAEEMIYSLPGRDRDDPDKRIEGASIRFAEAMAQCWGNNRTLARVVEIDRINKQVIAEGVFHDLETNAITTMRHARGIATKNGAMFGAEMIKTTANAACSIAKRNAILAGIPRGVQRPAERKARELITSAFRRLTPAQLSQKRREAIGYLGKKGVTPDQVYRRLGVKSETEIQAQDLLDLRSMADALRQNIATVEEIFEQGLALPSPNSGEKKPRKTLETVANGSTEPVQESIEPETVDGEEPLMHPISDELAQIRQRARDTYERTGSDLIPKGIKSSKSESDAWRAGIAEAKAEEARQSVLESGANAQDEYGEF